MKYYPSWTCHDCAVKSGGSMPDGHIATWHEGKCGCCEETKPVTEPRDYRYPDFTSLKARIQLTKEAQEQGEYD